MDFQSKTVGNAIVIQLTGRLDTTTAIRFEKDLLDKLKMNSNHNLVLNLRDINYISSSGLRVITTLAKILRKKNKRLFCCETPNYVLDVFKVTNITTMFTVCETEQEALDEAT